MKADNSLKKKIEKSFLAGLQNEFVLMIMFSMMTHRSI